MDHESRTDDSVIPRPPASGFDKPPRRRRRNLALTGRDVRVLELLVARRVETLDGLHELAFANRTRKRALNRLGELVSAGYLDRRSVDLPNSERLQSVYFLTSRGRTALQIRSTPSSNWFATRHWRLDLSEPSIPHQIVTNRVCDWLRARPVPEHLLPSAEYEPGRPRRQVRPDAIYEAREGRGGNKLVWVEVDLGHYNRKRIIEKVRAFQADRRACFEIIACPTNTRAYWISAVLRDTFGYEIWDRVDVRTFESLRGCSADAFPGGRAMLPSVDFPSMLTDL